MLSLIPSEHGIMKEIRVLADQAFSRVAGAPILEGNHVRLLKDARENYPALLEAIGRAKRYIHFENYRICEDVVGREFADALIAKAGEGVHVRLIYDWMGCLGKTSQRFWKHLHANGIELRCYNPPRLETPFGLISRDHRKMLVVDGNVGFVTGLCIGQDWVGIPEKRIEPWRDTGVEVQGSAVADIDRAFAHVWAMLGTPVPIDELTTRDQISCAGDMNVRIVADAPSTAGMFRLDQLVAALARERLWLTDAYFAGTTVYVQALRAVAKDGVDVRLLVPNSTNIPIIKPLSRAGYRPLMEAGVRIFEWNGPMLHAKTAVADGHWARVGSTNLNIASWFGNCELDVVVENESFAQALEAMYLEDLTNATEVVLDAKQRIRVSGGQKKSGSPKKIHGGSRGRTTASVVRIGNAVGSSFTGKRLLDSVEARLLTIIGILLLFLATLIVLFPFVLSYAAGVILLWLGFALIFRGFKLHSAGRKNQRMAVYLND
jgi:cardiolipin synthase A/B